MTTKNDRGEWAVWGGAAAFLLLVVALIGYTVASYANERTITCTVTEKDRAKGSNGSSDARIYTENCGTLTVGDATLKGHFSSADTYAEIKPGETYEFTTIGFRIPLLSAFPNVIAVEETP